MPHVLILGQTLSGKTALAKALARRYRQRGVGVIVLDPIGDPEWSADFATPDPNEFFDVYRESRRCAAFFDEAGDVCTSHRVEMIRTATRGRHLGHRNHYIAQRATLIHRTIRDQCSEIFLFNSGLEDCKVLAAEWNAPEFRDLGPTLGVGDFLYKRRIGPVSRGRLFDD